jgi:phage shock protein C
MDSARRLYRPASGRMIGGVAAGFGTYFGVDIAIARIIWGVLLLAGVGFPAYVLCWIAMPREPVITIDGFLDDAPPRRSRFWTLVKMAVLLGVMAIIVANASEEFALVAFVIGLAVGLYFLWRNRVQEEGEQIGPRIGGLYRSETNRKIMGVFGGLGEILNVDPTILRVLGGIILIAGFPVIVPLYLLYAMVVPARQVITI